MGTDRADTCHGRGGDDYLEGAGGNDRLFGDDGDGIYCSAARATTGCSAATATIAWRAAVPDRLNGGPGNDTLNGGLDHEHSFHCGPGDDTVVASHGDWSATASTGAGRRSARETARVCVVRAYGPAEVLSSDR